MCSDWRDSYSDYSANRNDNHSIDYNRGIDNCFWNSNIIYIGVISKYNNNIVGNYTNGRKSVLIIYEISYFIDFILVTATGTETSSVSTSTTTISATEGVTSSEAGTSEALAALTTTVFLFCYLVTNIVSETEVSLPTTTTTLQVSTEEESTIETTLSESSSTSTTTISAGQSTISTGQGL